MIPAMLSTTGSVELLVVYLCFGLTVLCIAPVSGWMKSRCLAEPLLATCVGIAVGLATPPDASAVTPSLLVALEIARITIGIQCLNSGLAVGRRFYTQHWRSLLIYLGPVMVFMWLSSAAFVLAVFPELGVARAALIGAMLAPTDPVLASSIVSGKDAEDLPADVKDLLTAESAANDGLALPFVYLPLLFLRDGAAKVGAPALVGQWVWNIWCYEVLVGAAAGAALGAASARLLRYAARHNMQEKSSRLAFVVALALATLGGVQLMGADGILACFTAGLAFRWVAPAPEEGGAAACDAASSFEEDMFASHAIDLILTYSFFVHFGTVLPYAAWQALGVGRLLALSLAVLFLTRLPASLALTACGLAPATSGYADAAFVGWFGPVGVAAIYYALDAEDQAHLDGAPYAICSFIVLTHVVVFSVTAPLLTRMYKGHLLAQGPALPVAVPSKAVAVGEGLAAPQLITPAVGAPFNMVSSPLRSTRLLEWGSDR